MEPSVKEGRDNKYLTQLLRTIIMKIHTTSGGYRNTGQDIKDLG